MEEKYQLLYYYYIVPKWKNHFAIVDYLYDVLYWLIEDVDAGTKVAADYVLNYHILKRPNGT